MKQRKCKKCDKLNLKYQAICERCHNERSFIDWMWWNQKFDLLILVILLILIFTPSIIDLLTK